MFKKTTCPKCKKALNKDFEFCPYCGLSQNQDNKWGILGKNDQSQPQNNKDPFSQLMPGGLTGGILNKMVGNAMKIMEKEMQKEMQNKNNQNNQNKKVKRIKINPNSNFQLYINGKKVNMGPKENESNISQKKAPAQKKNKPKLNKELSLKSKQKFSKLPKEEPKTNIRRLSNKVIYELEMPGVKSIKDIAIRNLEKSIEIKAISKNKAYYKIIAVDLPIVNYSLEKNTLVLELEAKN